MSDPQPWQMEGAECTAAPVPDRVLLKGWRGRGVRAGNMGSILPRREQSKSGRGNYSSKVEIY